MSIPNPYASYRATQVVTSNQIQLIILQHDGAIRNLAKAAEALARRDYPAKAKAFSKAYMIIDHLWGTLDKENGGEVAKNLDAIYAYMHKRLIQANLRDDFGPIKEVIGHLRSLRDSWAKVDEELKRQNTSVLKKPLPEHSNDFEMAA